MSQGKKSKSGKKTQNTQSPVTRLFKKLGKNSDSSSSAERQNLLTQKKKKKQAEEKCDCKTFEDTRPQFVDACQDMSRHWKASQQKDACCAPQNEKRDETFSCTSCALTKLLTSDPPKLIFLLAIAFIFVVIVVVLNWFTCKSYPVFDSALMGEERRERRSNGDSMEDDKKPWDTSNSRLTNGLSELLGTDNTDGSNMHDVRMDNIANPSQELSNILDPVKVSEAYSSNSLRDFYRKLLKTDIQIKNLRKGFANFKRGKSNDFFDSNPLRTKRSLKIIMDAARTRPKAPSLNKRSINNLNIYYPPSFAMKAVRDIDKEIKEDPGVMDAIPDSNSAAKEAKEQKMLREYTQKSNRVEDAKYSHSTMHSKTANRQHEMNHPYSEDFEKVDKILRRLFDKQVRETVPNILETILNGEENSALKQVKKNASRNNVSNEEKTRKEKAHDEATKEPAIQLHNEPLETMRDKANPLREKAQHDLYKQTTTDLTLDNDVIDVDNEPQTEANLPEFTNGNFGFMVTVAITSLGSVSSKVRKEPADQKIYFPKPRQLLQHTHDEDKEDDDDGVDYEEQTKEPWDREKRMIKPRELEFETEPMSAPTMKLPKMKNSNWKVPVPLYHDELNYMIKAATKLATKKPSDKKQREKYAKDTTTPSGHTEYFQDNANDNIDELVQISQAYSDYGVLNSKKETIENDRTPGYTVELMTSDKGHEKLEGLKTKVDNPQKVPKQSYKLNSEIETKSMKGVLLKKLGFLLNNPVLEVKPNKHEDLLATPLKPSNLSTHKNTNYRYPGETVNIEVVNITEPKELKKYKEGNMYTRYRRSLKSIEPEMSNDDVLAAGDNNVEPNVINTVKLEDLKNERIKRNISEETDNNTTASVDFKEIVPRLNNDTLKNNTTSFGLGEMFGMVADLCMLLAGFDSNQEEKDYKFLYNLVTILNPNALKTKNKVLQDTLNNDTKSPLNDMLDSEMLQNIGHRSRVLLSFEEKVDNLTTVNEQEKEESSEPCFDTTKEHLDTSTENNKNSSITEKSNALDAAENRTVVKRSAIGNFISWNDLYDDEYGIKDPLENEMKDKSSVKYNDLLAKSENWIGAKFKQIASNMKERKNHWRQTGKKNQHFTDAIRTKDKNISKRAVNNPNKDSSKQTFEALTANMKKIFHDAAEAIHETTNREARSDNEQATTLMQQLVALMSELVNIQVRQKTCVQLPEDLRNFLAWLTTPKTQEHDDISFIIDSTYNTGPTSKNDNFDSFDMTPSNARSDCLGTIHDVQDLIQQYDEMSEEDKSKMSGVREYLEHQLDFLHKQLSSFNEYGFPVYQEHSIRKRRQLQKSSNDKKITHRTSHRFYKYFCRKHTKPTVDEKVFPTEDYGTVKHRKGKGKNANETNENDRHNNNHVKPKIRHFEKNMKDDNVNEKRGLTRQVLNGKKVKKNLHDVYYSALATTNATTVSTA